MLPEGYISHHTANRLRVKIPSRKGDASYFNSLKEHLSGYREIEEVQVNPMTGSLLLLHRFDIATIKQLGATNNLFLLRSEKRSRATLNQKVLNSFGHLNQSIKVSTGGELDIPSVAFLGLVGAGLYEIIMGNLIVPAWYTAFWYASSVLLTAKSSQGNDNANNT